MITLVVGGVAIDGTFGSSKYNKVGIMCLTILAYSI